MKFITTYKIYLIVLVFCIVVILAVGGYFVFKNHASSVSKISSVNVVLGLSSPLPDIQNALLGRWSVVKTYQSTKDLPSQSGAKNDGSWGFVSNGNSSMLREYDDKNTWQFTEHWSLSKQGTDTILNLYDWVDDTTSSPATTYKIGSISSNVIQLLAMNNEYSGLQSITLTRVADAATEAKPYAGFSSSAHDEICTHIGAGQSAYFDDSSEAPLPITCAIDIGHDTNVSLIVSENNDISITKDGKTIFTDTDDTDGGFDPSGPFLTPDYVGFSDITFDEYKDLVVMTNSAAYNFTYAYYVYNPKTGMYDSTPILSDIVNPEFDPSTKTMVSHDKGRGLDDIYTDDTYAFQNGKYVLVREEVQDMVDFEDDSKGYTNTVSELRNGKMVQISKTHLSSQDITGQ